MGLRRALPNGYEISSLVQSEAPLVFQTLTSRILWQVTDVRSPKVSEDFKCMGEQTPSVLAKGINPIQAASFCPQPIS